MCVVNNVGIFLFKTAILLFILSFSVNATRLPPEHEVARLMLSIESSVENANWAKAKVLLTALDELEVVHPVESLYYSGLVHFNFEQYFVAQEFLEHYVVKAGMSGEYYSAALRLITLTEELDQTTKQQKSLSEESSPTQIQIFKSEEQTYIQSLLRLFLTEDPVEALALQINSLLTSHPFTGSRIKKRMHKEGVQYRLTVKDRTVQLQIKTYLHGLPTLSTNNVDILGLDPFIRYACSSQEFACWVYHHANGFDRWIVIDYQETVVKELSRALTKLVQTLQQSY